VVDAFKPPGYAALKELYLIALVGWRTFEVNRVRDSGRDGICGLEPVAAEAGAGARVRDERIQASATAEERAANIGMSVPFTVFLGAAEFAGAIALAVFWRNGRRWD
jgi:hypothetical protein